MPERKESERNGEGKRIWRREQSIVKLRNGLRYKEMGELFRSRVRCEGKRKESKIFGCSAGEAEVKDLLAWHKRKGGERGRGRGRDQGGGIRVSSLG